MRFAWATDIHLDCVGNPKIAVEKLATSSERSDGIIITGDISVGPGILPHLRLLEDTLQKPIYFVLGNHDYYSSDIIGTRRKVAEACRFLTFAKYLGALQYVRLDNNTALVGSDGWYDAYNGSPEESQIIMNDWLKIADFQHCIVNSMFGKSIDKSKIIEVSRAISMASVRHVLQGIKIAAQSYDSIVVATHVPPFIESYSSKKYDTSPPHHLYPWYTSRLMGEMLLSAAKTYPHVQFTVLSGHTHGEFEGDILPNLRARVGKSQYGEPQIAGYIDI